MSYYRKKGVNLPYSFPFRVITLFLCLCAACQYSYMMPAAMCYAKSDTDQEKAEKFVTAYYEAHSEEGIETLPDYVEDADDAEWEMIVLETCLKSGVEKYGNIDAIIYPLSDKASWLAIVTYELIVDDFDIGIPGMISIIVRKQEDGSLKICDDSFGDMEDSEREALKDEIYELVMTDAIIDINTDVNNRYQTILVENPDIVEWIQNLSDEIYQAGAARAQQKDAEIYETEQNESYVVREGDCLWRIAEEQFGDGMYWSRIYETNRELIGDNPDLLYVGWELKIDIDPDSPGTYDPDKTGMQEEVKISDAKSDLSEERRENAYLTETVYTDESCRKITFGDVSCGQNHTATAQVEEKIDYKNMRAEYRVTSDRLKYTAGFSAVPSDDDESKLINTWNVTPEDDKYRVPAIQWISDGLTWTDYPVLRDMNADGYLDLIGYAYTPDTSSRSMEASYGNGCRGILFGHKRET